MKLTRAAAIGALVLGGMATGAPAASADPSAFGTYIFEAQDGESATWNVRPCPGDPPGCVRVAEFGNSKRAPWSADAHYSVGSWFMFVPQPDAVQCEDGTTAPGQNTYSWDNATLSGNASVLTNGVCGADKKNLSIPFTLNKIGGAPVQAPDDQAEGAPYSPPPPAPVAPAPAPAPGAVAPAPEALPAAPLPAESPAAT